MKRLLFIIIICISVLNAFQSCQKDLGNYTYTDFDTLKIGGIDSSYLAYNEQSFKIEPNLNLSSGGKVDPSNYTYEWYTINQSSTVLNGDKKKVLGNKLNLDTVISLAPANYHLHLRVRNTSNNTLSEFITKLSVTSVLSNGWLVLSSIDGKSRLDMLNYNLTTFKYEFYQDILKNFARTEVEGAPKLVMFLNDRDAIQSKYVNRIYVGTDKTTISFDNQQNTWTDFRNLRKEIFRATPEAYHAEVIQPVGGGKNMCYILDSEGVLMHQNVTQNMLYGSTINRLNGGVRLNISKFIAPYYGNYSAYAVVFDKQNQRFLVHNSTNYTLLIPSSSDPELFTPEDMKMDLVYMERVLTATNQFYALLKNPTNNRLKLVRFTHDGTVFNPLAVDDIENPYQMESAEWIAADPTFGYIYYTMGSKIYQYDPFNKKHSLALDAGTRRISKIKFQKLAYIIGNSRYNEFAKRLIVCTYDAISPNTSGKMDFYDINLSGAPKLAESYSGFGKIVDVCYRE
ncbi:hypothetical protein HX021_13960 [Sphingobacterium sp. N143]|uniref:PKD-like family lipoprotein n=1 Tax=Sphingobacterium sp. N143 TaxID=2746727 RepID=UPI002575CD7E|nr:PKD-like family lipoprotein [Sphingobacterium sp. N143]MDM1295389.1 hypothetical protein [Sphingobacterium sp. N143]